MPEHWPGMSLKLSGGEFYLLRRFWSGLRPSGGESKSPERAQRAEGGVEGQHHSKEIMPAWLYILRLQSTSLWSGSTRPPEKRLNEHFAGGGLPNDEDDPPIARKPGSAYLLTTQIAVRRGHILGE